MKTFKGGVHAPDSKYLTENLAIVQMPIVPDYYLALSQHIGAPAVAVVKAGDKVKEGQLIAEGKGFSASVHSPVCGTVVDIIKRADGQGVLADYIHIKADSANNQAKLKPLGDDCSASAIVDRVAEAGIVGLGGAGFPTSIKLKPSEKIDTLVINAAECEPYLNSDNRLMIERTNEVVAGIKLIAKALGVSNIVVGIEANKMQAYQAMSSCEGITVELLKKKYPQGGEKMLIKALLNRVVPVGKLPMHVGVVVNNIATAYAVYDAVVNGKTLYSKVITVSGHGIATPKMLEVRVGTPWQAVVDFCGGLKDDCVKLVNGGPMMGAAINNLDVAIKKADSGLLALLSDEIDTLDPTPCIKCGMCVDHCPMFLIPNGIDFNTLVGDTEAAIKCGALNCMECGVCAYVCPAKRPIVQSVRLTKIRAKEKK